MAKMKRTRTNYAPEFETMEAMDAAVTLDEAMTAFLLSKKAESTSERTLKDGQFDCVNAAVSCNARWSLLEKHA